MFLDGFENVFKNILKWFWNIPRCSLTFFKKHSKTFRNIFKHFWIFLEWLKTLQNVFLAWKKRFWFSKMKQNICKHFRMFQNVFKNVFINVFDDLSKNVSKHSKMFQNVSFRRRVAWDRTPCGSLTD